MIERYTLPQMGAVWEDEFKFKTWLQIEILACEARCKMGEIPKEDVEVIKEKASIGIPILKEKLLNIYAA